MPLRQIVIWFLVACLCATLAFSCFAIGEFLAKEQGDPDGLFSLGGFGLFLVFLVLAGSSVIAGCATFLFWIKDR